MRVTVKAVENVGSPNDLLVTFEVPFKICGGKRTSTLVFGVRSEVPVNVGDEYELTLAKVSAEQESSP